MPLVVFLNTVSANSKLDPAVAPVDKPDSFIGEVIYREFNFVLEL